MKIPFFRRIADNADAQAVVGAGGLTGVIARLQGYSTAWNRIGAYSPDGFADAGAGVPFFMATFSYPYGYVGGATPTFARRRIPNIFKIIAAVAITAGTGAVVWTPAASRKFTLMGFCLSSSAAASMIFCDHVVGTPIFRSPLLAAAGVTPHQDLGERGITSATANNVLRLDVSANATVTGSVWGIEE